MSNNQKVKDLEERLAQMQADIVALNADITLREQETRTALDALAVVRKAYPNMVHEVLSVVDDALAALKVVR